MGRIFKTENIIFYPTQLSDRPLLSSDNKMLSESMRGKQEHDNERDEEEREEETNKDTKKYERMEENEKPRENTG